MGLLDMFRRKPMETRSSGSGFTAMVIAARDSYISGRSGLAELTSTVQSCVSLWEGAFALADVQGTDLLTRPRMAGLARALALRGEWVAWIGDGGLVLASDWDVATRNGEPRAYRLSLPDAGGGRTLTALAPEVLHVRIGGDTYTPWAGTSPLRRAALTAGLLQEVEAALHETYRDAPIGSLIVPLPENSSADMRATFRGRRGAALVVEGVAQATAAGLNPQIGQRPEHLTPDLQRAMTAETLAAARGGLMAAFGVLPSLFTDAAMGPLVREAQRHLATWTLQPIAELLATEATAKLGGTVTVDVLRPLQAFDAGGRARALATIVASLTQAKEAGIPASQMAQALAAVGWGNQDEGAIDVRSAISAGPRVTEKRVTEYDAQGRIVAMTERDL